MSDESTPPTVLEKIPKREIDLDVASAATLRRLLDAEREKVMILTLTLDEARARLNALKARRDDLM